MIEHFKTAGEDSEPRRKKRRTHDDPAGRLFVENRPEVPALSAQPQPTRRQPVRLQRVDQVDYGKHCSGLRPSQACCGERVSMIALYQSQQRRKYDRPSGCRGADRCTTVSDPETDGFISTRTARVASDREQVFSSVLRRPQGRALSAPGKLNKGTLLAQEMGLQGSDS